MALVRRRRPRKHILIPYNGKIADITHADTVNHTLDLAAALPETRPIIAVIVNTVRMGGTGVFNCYANEGAKAMAASGGSSTANFVMLLAGSQRLSYSLSVANDDHDVYCLGYVVES